MIGISPPVIYYSTQSSAAHVRIRTFDLEDACSGVVTALPVEEVQEPIMKMDLMSRSTQAVV